MIKPKKEKPSKADADSNKPSNVSEVLKEVDIKESSNTNLYYFEKGFHNTD